MATDSCGREAYVLRLPARPPFRPDQFKASLIALTSLASRDREEGGDEGPRHHTDKRRWGGDQLGISETVGRAQFQAFKPTVYVD